MLLSQALQVQGQRVLGLDINPHRLGMASTLNFVDTALHPQEHTQEIESWLASTPVGAVDAVFLSVVNPHTLAMAMRLVRNGGSLMMMAGNTAGNILDPKDFYYREINLLTSYSPSLEDLLEAHRMICGRDISLTPIITHPMPVDRFNEGLEQYIQGEAIKVFYEYPTL
jgi:L-iditol 2-dehydrogenase